MTSATPPVHRHPYGDTLTGVLRHQAASFPDRVVYTELAQDGSELASITYGAFERRVRAVAAEIQRSSRPGERALVFLPPGLDFITAFFACSFAGVIAVPVPYPDSPFGNRRQENRLRQIVKDADPSVILTTAKYASEAEDGPLGITARAVDVPAVATELADTWRDTRSTAETVALLQYTSGSTSAPKGVVLTQSNMTDNFAGLTGSLARHTWLSGSGSDFTSVTWLPPFHDMGLATLIFPVLVGGHCVLMSPTTFLMRPARWLEVMSSYRAQMTTGPNFAFDLCVDRIAPRDRTGLDLSRWEVAICGAEPVRASTLARFTQAFAPHGFRPSVFMPSYGLAEANVFATGTHGPHEVARLDVEALEQQGVVREAENGGPARSVVSCGRPPGNALVRIVDRETGQPSPPDRVGEIWLAGANVARGYWRDPEATRSAFGAVLPGEENAFLRTGDLGFLRDGQLYVTGRADDLIIIDGRNMYPQDLELTVTASHPAVNAGVAAVFTVPGDGDEEVRVVAVAEMAQRRRTTDPAGTAAVPARREVVLAVRREVAEEHQVGLGDVVLLTPGRLPRTTSGKVQRRETRRLYLSGGLDAWLWSGESAVGGTRA
ncbi:fatty acyl-AMP ligase [Streptomyces sp. NBC_00102]|uniref:fatty acyl-AMP ligase n=1 Tax=Streptomyces sp. NBC_00102 TaxID=2975652 RepID=UPI002255D267|nr:fatty acyl-AMP ligase [Streptomyces sp. NBC_00102]MCX5395501.1 fatty acyl-AMP ligase [Streptomyces sp. NBC_00102]